MLSTLLVLGLAPLPCSPTGPVTTAALTAAPTADADTPEKPMLQQFMQWNQKAGQMERAR